MLKAIIFDCLGVLAWHSATGWRRDEGLVTIIRELRAHYKTGLLSNLSLVSIDSIFSQAERRQLFDAVILAGEAGMDKSQPSIYHQMCAELGVRPAEAVFTDDDSRNITGAQVAGLRTILYRDAASSRRAFKEFLQKAKAL